jgi:hypothetical protein
VVLYFNSHCCCSLRNSVGHDALSISSRQESDISIDICMCMGNFLGSFQVSGGDGLNIWQQ